MLSFHSLYIMAKSKSGGTRGMLRGRIANDVYSIGKDGSGKKQQVVRSLAESVANPQTLAQMKGRMYMSTVMQIVSVLAKVVDHSFDNVPTGQPSVSEFIRLNYGLLKADAESHPSSGNYFGLVEYGQKASPAGKYIVSRGAAVIVNALRVTPSTPYVASLSGFTANMTAGQVRSLIGLADDDFITYVGYDGEKNAEFVRFRLSGAIPDATVVTAENFFEILVPEVVIGHQPLVDIEGNSLSLTFANGLAVAGTFITTRKVESGFEHSTAYLQCDVDQSAAADVAIKTYPLGSQRFLNGGDI